MSAQTIIGLNRVDSRPDNRFEPPRLEAILKGEAESSTMTDGSAVTVRTGRLRYWSTNERLRTTNGE